jgi:hypothetical protein
VSGPANSSHMSMPAAQHSLPLSASALASGLEQCYNTLNPSARTTLSGMGSHFANEEFQRLQVFASLASSQSMAIDLTSRAMLLSLLLNQQQYQQAQPSIQLPEVNHYLLMHRLNRMEQLQQSMAGPMGYLRSQQPFGVPHGYGAPSVASQESSARRDQDTSTNRPLQPSRSSANATSIEYDVPPALPALLCRPTDSTRLSHLQLLLRQQIEAFQATESDLSTHVRGRNKSIKLGQVGIRCRHCAHVPAMNRYKGSTYFPTSVWGLYQASQNMCMIHLQGGQCTQMPPAVKVQFLQLADTKRAAPSSGAGRTYWAEMAQQLGLVDTTDGIFFVRNLPSDVCFPVPASDDGPGVYRKTAKNKR